MSFLTIYERISKQNNRNTRAKILGIVIALQGILNISSALLFDTPSRLEWLRQILPEEIITGSRSLVLVSGFFLVSVAWNLGRKKKMAWIVTVWLLIISIFSYFLKDLNFKEISITTALLAILWFYRKDFTVKSDPTAFERLLTSTPMIAAVLFLYSTAGFYLFKTQFSSGFTLEKVITDTFNLIILRNPVFFTPNSSRASFFIDSIKIASGAVILNIGFNLMRPYLITEIPTWEKEMALEILRRYGKTTFSFFTLGDDKSYYFNEEGSAYIAYVVKHGVAIAAGDPVGPEEQISSMIIGFKLFAEENGWSPTFNTVEPQYRKLYELAGFELSKTGEEAIIDLTSWNVEGSVKKDIRTAHNKGKRLNWEFTVYESKIDDPRVIGQIDELNKAWLDGKIGGEMGFMMGLTPIHGGEDTLVAIVSDEAGKLMAFITLAPIFGRQGWMLDHIRRDNGSPNGVIDFLVVSLISWLQERGYLVLSMGEAPLHGVGDNNPSFVSLGNTLRLVYENFNSIYNYKQLYDYKAKWGPLWEDRFIAYISAIDFPRIVLAIASAHLPNLTIKEILKTLSR